MKKLTPVLVVEEIEPSLRLWVERLGFEKTAEVPEGDKLGFVILARGGVEIMYQTRLSAEREVEREGLPQAMRPVPGRTALFIELDGVSELDEIRQKVEGFEVIVPYRETAYGAKELWLREPGGHLVGFAAFG
jgi:uncharacterized glyoxalase superfamily protein PhnB